MSITSSVALSLIAFGFSKYLGSGDFSDAVYSELGVGSFGDIFIGGSEKALSKIFKNPPPDYDKDQLNHHLNKAARKAVLLATWYAGRSVLLEYDEFNGRKQEKAWLTKLGESLKTKIEKAYDEIPQTYINEQDVLAIFNESDDRSVIEQKLIAKLHEEAFEIIRTDVESFSLFNQNGFDLLKKNIEQGWTEQLNPTSPEKKYDWFSLVCGIFNEECKNPTIGFAIQNKLFRDAFDVLKTFGKSFDELYQNLSEIKQATHRTENRTEFLIDFTKDFRTEIDVRLDNIEQLLKRDADLSPEERQAKTDEIIRDYLDSQIKDYPIGEIVGEVYQSDKFFVDRITEQENLPNWLLNDDKIVVIKGVSGDGKTALMTEVLRAIIRDNSIVHTQVKGILTFYFRDFSGKFLDVNLLDICKKADARLAKSGANFGFALQYEEFRKSNPLDVPVQIIANLCRALDALGDIWFIFDNFESALQNGQIKDPEIEQFVRAALAQNHLRLLITSQVLPVISGINNIRQCSIADLPPDYAKEFLWSKGRALKENGTDCGLAEATGEQFEELFAKLLPAPISLISFVAYLETLCDTEGKVFADVLADETLFLGFGEFDADDKNKGARVLIRRQFELLSEIEQLVLKALSIFPKAVEFPVLQSILPLSLEREAILSILKSNSLIRKGGKNLYELLPLPKEVIAKQFEQTEKNNHTTFNIKAALFYRSIHKPVVDCYTLEDFDTYFKEIEHCYQAGLYEFVVQIINEIIPKTTPLGMMKETLERSRKIKDKLDDKPEAKANNHINIGISLASSGRLDEAINEYDEAVEIYKDLIKNEGRIELANSLASAFMNRGNALDSSGKLDEAITDYDKAIEIRKDLVENQGRIELADHLARAFMNRGSTLFNLGKLDEAITEYDKTIEIHKDLIENQGRTELMNDLASAFMNRGNALDSSGKLDEAITDYDKAIEIHKDLIENQGRIELMNDLAMAFLNKGVALENQDDSAGAVAMFGQAVEFWERNLLDFVQNLPNLVKALRLRVASLIKLTDWGNTAVDAIKSLTFVTIFTHDENFAEHFKRQIGAEFGELLYQIKQLSDDNQEKIFTIANEIGRQNEEPIPFGDILRGYVGQIDE